MAAIYIAVSILAMMGVCSLAVDFGRVVTAKTELGLTEAACGAAAYQLAMGSSNSTVASAAAAMAANNTCDGTTITISTSSDVTIGSWNTSTHVFTAGGTANPASNLYSAVKVHAGRTHAWRKCHLAEFRIDPALPRATSTSLRLPPSRPPASPSPSPETQTPGSPCETTTGHEASIPDSGYTGANVNSQHPWQYDLAGPIGGSASSGEPYSSPVQASISITPGSIIMVSNVSGNVQNHPGCADDTADGTTGSTYSIYSDDAATTTNAPGYTGAGNSNSASDATGSEHGLSSIASPINSLLGVFLNANAPDTGSGSSYTASGTTPPGLDFSTQAQRDYGELSPLVQQPFYFGNGNTSSSVQQGVIVPPGATRLFLGTMDGHEWSNNGGSYSGTLTQASITTVQ